MQGPSRSVTKVPDVPPAGRRVLPGDYRITVRFQGEEQSVSATVLPDPRVEIPMEARLEKDALRAASERLMTRLHAASQKIAPVAKQVAVVRQRLALEEKPEEGDDPMQPLRDALDAVEKAHQDTLDAVWGEEKKVQGISRGNDGLLSKAQRHMRISSTDDAPNRTEQDGLVRAEGYVEQIEQRIQDFVEGDLVTFRQAVANSGVGLLPRAR